MGYGDTAISTGHPQEVSEPTPSTSGQMVEGTVPYQSATHPQMYQAVDRNAMILSGVGKQVPIPRDQRQTLYPPTNDGFTRVVTNTSYSDQMLPISTSQSADTVVITDSSSTAYMDAFSSSNRPLSFNFTSDHPNSAASSPHASASVAGSEFDSTPMVGTPITYYNEPLMTHTPVVSMPNYNQCPTNGGGSSGNNAGSTQSTNSGQSSCVTGYSSQNYGGLSMVVGVGGNSQGGGGGGGGEQPWNPPTNLPRSHYNDPTVLVDEDAGELLRRMTEAESPVQGLSGVLGDYGLFKEIDRDLFPGSDCLPEASAVTPSDPSMKFYAGFETESTSVQPMQEESRGSIGENFDMIKMMNKPYVKPSNLGLVAPTSPIPAQTQQPASDYGLYSQQHNLSPAPAMGSPQAPIQVSNPSPHTPPPSTFPTHTPSPVEATTVPPTPADQRPFDCNTFIEDGLRYCELRARKDLSPQQSKITHEALFFSYRMAMTFEECVSQRNDLKVANDLCAKLCEYEFVSEEKKLMFSMPAGCVPLNQWLEENGKTIDLRERQFIFQQILNTLATVHTVGSRDKLNLWGSFMAWVAPDMRVYLLLDFTVMLAKMEQSSYGARLNFDPRMEDIRAVGELYQLIIYPFVNRDANWVSPGVKQLLYDFEQLLMDPTSVYRMAEVARMFGERRMCKLEVDVMSLDVTIFCVEHELLYKALSTLQSLVPTEDDWAVQWAATGRQVLRTDLASAERRMRIRVDQSPYLSDNQGLTLQGGSPYGSGGGFR